MECYSIQIEKKLFTVQNIQTKNIKLIKYL